MNYELKDKITVTKELLSDLEIKGWQEIEYLQAQIANLAEGPTNDKLRQLLKNLLTSYYIFTGGIETLASKHYDDIVEPTETPPVEADIKPEIILNEIEIPEDDFTTDTENDYEVSEPFEYFVDFDEPVGDPLSDEDLYG